MAAQEEVALAPGTILQERYEILGQIGVGGFGRVYRARHLNTGQDVAVKVMRILEGPFLDRELLAARLARFRRETQLCAQLHHPNIVRLIDSGQAGERLWYSVFEYVPGQTLEQVLTEEGALPPREACHLMLQVLDALACAHGRGIIHRDIKPANIMVVSTGVRRNALVFDFNIGALDTGGQSPQIPHERLTRSGEWIGTPQYAAPEYLRGQAPTPRVDLYAWGLVFIECLTGEPAIPDGTQADVLYHQMNPAPVVLPEPLAAHPLGRLLQRVTAKNVDERNLTAEQLHKEIEALEQELDTLVIDPLNVGLSEAGRGQPSPSPALSEEGKTRQDRHRRVGESPSGDEPLAETPPEPLAQTKAERPPAAPTVLGLAGERRQVTALCCNLVARAGGSAMGLEEMEEALRAWQARWIEIAQKFQGHVVSALGEQLLFYFGYPVAKEDDAVRAAQGALDMAQKLREANAERPGTAGPRRNASRIQIDLRMGIHTGLVHVGPESAQAGPLGSGHLLGVTAKTAARLCTLAPPGGIAVSGDSAALLRRQFHLVPVDAIPEEGGLQPRMVFHLTEAPWDDSIVSLARVSALPHVGRAQELELLLGRWQQVVQGSGQCILVVGEPGIGKSSLAMELVRRIDGEGGGGGDAYRCLSGRCLPEHQSSSLRPIREVLERLLDLGQEPPGGAAGSPSGDEAEQAEKLVAWLERHGFAGRGTEGPGGASEGSGDGGVTALLAEFLDLPLGSRWSSATTGATSERRQDRLVDALVSLFVTLAEEKPLLLLVEDVHWADEATLSFLGRLMKEGMGLRMGLFLTARPEFVSPWPAAALLQLQLGRFVRGEIAEMVAAILGGKALSPAALGEIVNRTDGIPLFVEELTRTMVESGTLVEHEDRFELAAARMDLEIPSTLRGLLMARLDRLGRIKETAQLAAALGREFSHEVLCAVSPLTAAEVQADLERLVAGDLVLPVWRQRTKLYSFKHALIRDVAYESLPRRTRQELHARIAQVLEERFPELVKTQPQLLAQHHAAAEQMQEAIAYAQRALQRALQLGADAEAMAHANQALGWLSAWEDPRERARVELGIQHFLVWALHNHRGYASPALKSAVERLQALVDLVGDAPESMPALRVLCIYYQNGGQTALAYSLAERLLELARKNQDIGQEVAILPSVTAARFDAGRLVEARQFCERLLSLYDERTHRGQGPLDGLDSKVLTHAILAISLWLLGEPDQALRHAEAGMAWAGEVNHILGHLYTLYVRVTFHLFRREQAEAVRWSESFVELANRLGPGLFHATASVMHAMTQGDLEATKRLMSSSAVGLSESVTASWNCHMAELEMQKRNWAAALVRLEGSLRHIEATGIRTYLAEVHRLKGHCLFAQDRSQVEAAEAELRTALVVAREQGAKMLELRAAVTLAEIWEEQGRGREAGALVRPIYERFTEGLRLPDLLAARAVLEKGGRATPDL
ncbi:MAG TPA: AAA family ATPase [Polyangia bacterium]|nr:AAA family ATPase [Polyangia bacterium]